MHGYVIGLTGPARSGKNTVAGLISEIRDDWTVVFVGFADALKISAARALGFEGSDGDLIEAMDILKNNGEVTTTINHGQRHVSGRRFLQLYGTEAHRDVFGEDFWIDRVLPDPSRTFAGRADEFDMLVVTDVRFPNEAARIRECDGEIWRVERPGTQITESAHSSEGHDLKYDALIVNDGSLDDLRDYVRAMMVPGRRLS